MVQHRPAIQYPRRRVIRGVLREAARALFGLLTHLDVEGQKNLPEGGPLLVAANHFSYTDPAVVVRVTPWPLEVLGGFRQPNAPFWGGWILKLWGHLPVHRGTGARGALRAAEAVLAQGGVVGIAPEGGSWATVLRPARPGAAFLAVRSGARILPIGIDGAPDILPGVRRGRWTPTIRSLSTWPARMGLRRHNGMACPVSIWRRPAYGPQERQWRTTS